MKNSIEILKHVRPSIAYKQQAIEYIKEFYKYNSAIHGVGGTR